MAIIKVKKKKCCGTGKAKGHGCGGIFFERVYGLGKSCGCYSKWLLNTPEGQEIVKKGTLKATKPRKDFEAYEKQLKDDKTLPYLLVSVRTAVHRYVRERDKGLSCISCGVPHRSNFQAGHCYAAGSYPTLKYNYSNINSQCAGCNLMKGGNETEYLLRLPHRIGREPFNKLVSLAESDKRANHKWDREELAEIRSEANRLYRELKKLSFLRD